jgi:hypothetical protein
VRFRLIELGDEVGGLTSKRASIALEWDVRLSIRSRG